MRWVALIATVASVACSALPGPTAPGATVTPTEVAAPTPTATPAAGSPAPATSATSGPVRIVVFSRAANVPSDFRYVEAAETAAPRGAFLVDMNTGVVTRVVTVSVGPSGFASFSYSADGRRILVSVTRPDAHATISIVDVETAAVRTLYEDPELGANYSLAARLSRDGSQYAFPDAAGVRLGTIGGGAPRQLVPHIDPRMVGGMWSPLEFSPDGRWLAMGRSSEADNEIAIAAMDTGRVVTVGAGTMATWRKTAPELLVMSGRNAFGGRSMSYLYDVASGRTTSLEPTGTEVRGAPRWSPPEDRFLYLAAPEVTFRASAFVRVLAETTAKRIDPRTDLIDAWWSRDGSKIYALVPRQDALGSSAIGNYLAIEMPSGRVIATVCRGDTRAACP
jgi:dipeptidyl aminopeptidase/acylaminoacyl peptidase